MFGSRGACKVMLMLYVGQRWRSNLATNTGGKLWRAAPNVTHTSPPGVQTNNISAAATMAVDRPPFVLRYVATDSDNQTDTTDVLSCRHIESRGSTGAAQKGTNGSVGCQGVCSPRRPADLRGHRPEDPSVRQSNFRTYRGAQGSGYDDTWGFRLGQRSWCWGGRAGKARLGRAGPEPDAQFRRKSPSRKCQFSPRSQARAPNSLYAIPGDPPPDFRSAVCDPFDEFP